MTDLVKSISIENMLNQRRAVAERLKEAKRLYDEAHEIAKKMGLESGIPTCSYGDRYRRDLGIERADYLSLVLAQVDAQAWDYLMKESGLRTFMDSAARESWDSAIRGSRTPELNAENVRHTFEDLYGQRGEMFERGVITVFKNLSWDYKSNSPCRFGKKIIIEYFGGLEWSANSTRCDRLDDLERVFHVLDGKPEPDHRNGWYNRFCGGKRESESDYMAGKRFKNGNGHMTFKRPDLVDKLNEIVARHYSGALPPRI